MFCTKKQPPHTRQGVMIIGMICCLMSLQVDVISHVVVLYETLNPSLLLICSLPESFEKQVVRCASRVPQDPRPVLHPQPVAHH